jgi:hypothetical protein
MKRSSGGAFLRDELKAQRKIDLQLPQGDNDLKALGGFCHNLRGAESFRPAGTTK